MDDVDDDEEEGDVDLDDDEREDDEEEKDEEEDDIDLADKGTVVSGPHALKSQTAFTISSDRHRESPTCQIYHTDISNCHQHDD